MVLLAPHIVPQAVNLMSMGMISAADLVTGGGLHTDIVLSLREQQLLLAELRGGLRNLPIETVSPVLLAQLSLGSLIPFRGPRYRYALYLVFSAGFELLQYLKIPVPAAASDYILGKFRASALSFRDQYLNKELAEQTKNFQEGMSFLIGKQNLSPEKAYETIIRYILTRTEISLRLAVADPSVIEGYYDLTVEDIFHLEQTYSLTAEQMDLIAGEVAIGVNLEEMGGVVRIPLQNIIDRREGELSWVDFKEALTRTQEAADRLKSNLHRTHRHIIENVLTEMAQNLALQIKQLEKEPVIPAIVTVALGEWGEIEIPLQQIAPSERLRRLKRSLAEWQRVLQLMRKSGNLSPKVAEELVRWSGEFAPIGRFQKLSGERLEGEIAAIERGIDLLFDAFNIADPVSRAKSRLLVALAETESGFLGYQTPGDPIRVVARTPTIKVHERGDSRVGPYTFHESRLAKIDGKGSIRFEPAMVYVDRRGRPGLVTVSEVKLLVDFEKTLLMANADMEIIKAYHRFLTDVKRAWNSIDWREKNALIDFGKDPKKSVATGAKLIKTLAPGYALIRLVRQVGGELLESRVADGLPNEEVTRLLHQITEKFLPFFQGEMATDEVGEEIFVQQMKNLEENILSGDRGAMLKTRGKMKDLVFRRMDRLAGQSFGHLAGNVRTGCWGEELEGWIKAATSGVGNLSPETLKQLSLLRINQGEPPSVETARLFFVEGKYDEALNEYGRIAIDGRAHVVTRLTALAQLFRIAYLQNNSTWMHKALGEMDYLLAAGIWDLRPEEKRQMRLALRLEKLGLVRIGDLLRKSLES